MPRALVVEILGNAQQFGAELDRAAGKTRQMSKVAGVAGLAIAGGLAVGLDKSVKAAVAGQQSTARLEAAFKSSGESAGKYAGAIDTAEASGRNLGFANTDVRGSLGSLEIATHDGASAIKDLGVAEDIARFKHVDLETASKSLTMAMAGSQRAVKQLGLSITPLTTAEDRVKLAFKDHTTAAYASALATAKLQDKQATAAQVIDTVSKKMHGQADAFSQTAAGGMARFHAQTEQIEETLGNILLPFLTRLSGVLADATGWMSRHAEVAKIAVVALGGLAAVLLTVSVATKVSAAAQAVWNAVTIAGSIASNVFAAGVWLVNAALAANPIVLVVAGLVLLGAALYLAWTKSQTFREVVLSVWHAVRDVTSSFVNFFTSTVPQAFETVKNKITGAMGDVKNWLQQHWPIIATIISGPFAPLVAVATNAFGIRDKLIGAFDDIVGGAKEMGHDLASAFSSFGSAVVSAIKAPINALIALLDAFHITIGKVSILGHTVFGGLDWHPFHITPLAEGGIVTAPMLAMVGERGPEAVIPLDRAGGLPGGGGITVRVGPVYGTVDAAFARALSSTLATQLRAGAAPQLQQAIRAI